MSNYIKHRRRLDVVWVDSITGEVRRNDKKIINNDIKSHKIAFLRLCEEFYDLHFKGDRRSDSLWLTFPDTSKDEELPLLF